jgi:hypothetical protein
VTEWAPEPAATAWHDRRHQAMPIWAGTNLQVDWPLIDCGADDRSMILLQVVTASAQFHNSEVLKLLRKALSQGRRYQNAWISCEKQLRGKTSALEHCVLSLRLNTHPTQSHPHYPCFRSDPMASLFARRDCIALGTAPRMAVHEAKAALIRPWRKQNGRSLFARHRISFTAAQAILPAER